MIKVKYKLSTEELKVGDDNITFKTTSESVNMETKEKNGKIVAIVLHL